MSPAKHSRTSGSLCPASVCLCVCHTFLVVTHSYVSQVRHAFLVEYKHEKIKSCLNFFHLHGLSNCKIIGHIFLSTNTFNWFGSFTMNSSSILIQFAWPHFHKVAILNIIMIPCVINLLLKSLCKNLLYMYFHLLIIMITPYNRIEHSTRIHHISDRQREGLLRIKFVIYGTPF